MLDTSTSVLTSDQVSAKKLATPVGELTLFANAATLIAVVWEFDDPKRLKIPCHHTEVANSHPILFAAQTQLSEFFAGTRRSFDLPMSQQGTAFQRRVWQALSEIPYGMTTSYGELARKVGSPNGWRAVGDANRRNPFSVIVPCHRVVASNGRLTGFAGGLTAKSLLLRLEDSYSRESLFTYRNSGAIG